jgi:hypothetical protein
VAGRFGRNETIWIAIHKCMETTPGISLYSYLYHKPAKMLCLFFYYLLCFLFNKIRKEGRTGSAWKLGVGSGRGGGTNIETCK